MELLAVTAAIVFLFGAGFWFGWLVFGWGLHEDGYWTPARDALSTLQSLHEDTRR